MGMSHGGVVFDPKAMSFADHADRVIAFAEQMELHEFSLLAHDTGGTIARLVAAKAKSSVRKLVLLNTEIPFHRPPFIPLYQKMLGLPGSQSIISHLMRSAAYRRSALGFGGVFHDQNLIEGEFKTHFIDYWLADRRRMLGQIEYLRQLDFSVIDTLDEIHRTILAPIQFIWGANDTTFPASLGLAMSQTIDICRDFSAIQDCCFLPQEEKPAEVVAKAIPFLSS